MERVYAYAITRCGRANYLASIFGYPSIGGAVVQWHFHDLMVAGIGWLTSSTGTVVFNAHSLGRTVSKVKERWSHSGSSTRGGGSLNSPHTQMVGWSTNVAKDKLVYPVTLNCTGIRGDAQARCRTCC
tara:strand:+ start:12774 stop:13157 length:384 start_codon:yes stop_codon:yes gene_type:complete